MRNDTLLVKEILSQIDTAIETIKHRFEPVTSVDYFLDTPEGQEKLDSICMLFIANSVRHIANLLLQLHNKVVKSILQK